jgi:hypothetical protein
MRLVFSFARKETSTMMERIDIEKVAKKMNSRNMKLSSPVQHERGGG